MENTNIGYGIVNLESFREYAERVKKLAFKKEDIEVIAKGVAND